MPVYIASFSRSGLNLFQMSRQRVSGIHLNQTTFCFSEMRKNGICIRRETYILFDGKVTFDANGGLCFVDSAVGAAADEADHFIAVLQSGLGCQAPHVSLFLEAVPLLRLDLKI